MSTGLEWVRWVHLLSAAVWTGGLIVMGGLVLALRRAGAPRDLLRTAARAFGRISWTAMTLALITGALQVHMMGMSWAYGGLHLKLTLVTAALVLSLYHQVTARDASPGARGIIQLLILLVSLGIFAAAVAL